MNFGADEILLPVLHRFAYKIYKLMGNPPLNPSRLISGRLPYDNAPMESFWGTLKNELVHHRRFATRQQAKDEVSEYIEIFYNRQRTQAGLGYLAPAAFCQQYYQNQLVA
jgi:transposase InsO family protein